MQISRVSNPCAKVLVITIHGKPYLALTPAVQYLAGVELPCHQIDCTTLLHYTYAIPLYE